MVVEYFERRSSVEKLERVERPRSHSWVHMSGRQLPTAELAAQYSLDINTLCDAYDLYELPRAEFKRGNEYIFLRMPSGAPDSAKTAPLLAVITPDRLVTVATHTAFTPLDVAPFLTTATDVAPSLSVATIAAIAAVYETSIRYLSEKISRARKRLSRREIQTADFVEFVAIEDSLNEYKRSLEGNLSVVRQLQLNRRQFFSPRDLEALEDISLHMQQLLVAIGSSHQTITAIHNAYSTVANNVLNQRMKMLTTITILLAIPNVFYGMYGMNLVLPFQKEWWAYPVVVGFSLALSFGVYILAKRLRLF